MGRPLDEDIIIKILERWQKAFKENSHYVSASDLSLVIKDVKELPTIQPEPTDEQVEEYCKRRCLHVVTDDFFHIVQPEPKWIPCEDCERRCKRWGNLKTLQE